MKSLAIVLVILLFGACACTSMGSKEITDPSRVSKIEAGKSTKADVKATLGDPAKINFTDNNEEVWEYVHVRGTPRGATFIPVIGLFAGGADLKTQTLTIRFDKGGVVKNMGEGKMTGGGGSVLD